MAGSGENNDLQARRVRDIRRRSRVMRLGGALNAEDTGSRRRAIRFIAGCFLGLACGFAGLMGQTGRPLHDFPLQVPALGGTLNDLIFSVHPVVVGNPAADLVLGAAAKALAVCLCAAFVPLCARLWSRLRDNAQGDLYITFWGTTVGLPFLWFFLKDFLGPLLVDVFNVIA